MNMSLIDKTIDALLNEFSPERLEDFFSRKCPAFGSDRKFYHGFDTERFKSVLRLGELQTDDNSTIAVFAIEHAGELTERTSKRLQFDLARKILLNDLLDAGFFVFYDNHGNFRFSFIYSIYRGVKRDFSSYRRYSYYHEKGIPHRTFKEALLKLSFETIDSIIDAFSAERVTEEFFEAYRHAIREIIVPVLDSRIDFARRHSFAQQLLSRILFIYFLQRKRWLKWKNYQQDPAYLKNLWFKYKTCVSQGKQPSETFYAVWLTSLFFGAFNKKQSLISKDLPEEIRESYTQMPFLNGGLFTKNPVDDVAANVPDEVFAWLFEPDPDGKDRKKGFLELFNFTIDESLPMDIEVAVDPEMLGKVYESLILEEERGKSGIFYTPRVEIDFMCRLSLTEYLFTETSIDKNKLIAFIYDPATGIENLSRDECVLIKEKLYSVRIVDPAVGSGSFLVGMMNILIDLHSHLTRRIEQREENLFALKKRIINDNLYGVDVKDWAVMVCELRLWLSMVLESNEKEMDIYNSPLLPNLTFKIRQGDSLVEEIGGIQICLRGESAALIPESVRTSIDELIDRKRKFFSDQGKSADLHEIAEIRHMEQTIFAEILNKKIRSLDQKIAGIQEQISHLEKQKDLFGKQDKRSSAAAKELNEQVRNLQKERERFVRARDELSSGKGKDYFIWEIDFAEVFASKGGFDIVIGNPPYVRQEQIAPPLDDPKNYPADEWAKIKKAYKAKLAESVRYLWNDIKTDGKSDLYVYFYYHGLSITRPDGIFCFINSNSWLDVDYGKHLQEFLLKHMQLIYVFDNLKKRSFKQADVNTVIVLIRRPGVAPEDYLTRFVAFKKPFEEAINPANLQAIDATTQPVFDAPDYRIVPKSKKDLWLEGVETPDETDENELMPTESRNLPYIGNKWGGKYLRAPEIYYKILEKGKGKLVRLGDIAEVRFGIKTGANEFFYLKPVGLTVKEVAEISEKNPAQLIRVKNASGWEGEIEAMFLKPFLFSLKEIEKYHIDISLLNNLILDCNEKELRENVKKYIEYGEKFFSSRPSVKNRKKWYVLPNQKAPDFISNRFLGERFGFPYTTNIVVCDVFFVGKFKSLDKLLGVGLLNSTLSFLFLEVISRKTYGIGVAYIYGPEINDLKILKKDVLNNFVVEITNIFEKKTINRPIHSIFTELGFDPGKPIREQEPNPLPDRKALDDVVFDVLGLTEDERREVYWAVAELVQNRLQKAKNV